LSFLDFINHGKYITHGLLQGEGVYELEKSPGRPGQVITYFLFLAFAFAFFAAGLALAFALAAPPLLPPPILNILVPQTVHVPEIALRPFFMVTCFSPFISLFALHFTQYACVANVRRFVCLDIRIAPRRPISIFWPENNRKVGQKMPPEQKNLQA
jgi:hypothetical protein